MSSILKALKRVEESNPAEDTSKHPSVSRESLSRRPLGQPKKWFSGRNKSYLLASAAVLVAVIAAYYGWTSGSASRPDAGTAKEVRAQLPPRPPDPAPLTTAAPVRRVPPRPAPPAPPAPEPAASQAGATAQVETGASVQAPPPTSRVRPREGAAAPSAEARPPAVRGAAAERPSASRPAPGRAAEDNLSRLDESKLKVMAIAWASDPARRLAVVNGHIVKEGESVEGFSVTQIRKDDIIVNDGGQSWRVELNLKSQQ